MNETMGDLIATLSSQEKECLRILATGKRGGPLMKELVDKGISVETFRSLVDEKLTSEQLVFLLEIADMWL